MRTGRARRMRLGLARPAEVVAGGDPRLEWRVPLGRELRIVGDLGAAGRRRLHPVRLDAASEGPDGDDQRDPQHAAVYARLAPRLQSPAMPRYEFVEGSSSKFWEIELAGKGFTCKYGKIGATGQTTIKAFPTPAAAKTAYEKLIAEKTKKGYELAGKATKAKPTKASTKAEPATSGTRDARNADLEAAIIANPNDRDAWAIFADWLQEQGDPRGELASLHLNNQDKAAKKLLAKHADYFLGPLAEHQQVHDEGLNNASSSLRTSEQEKAWQKTQQQAFLWRHGFIHRCRLSHDSYSDETWQGQTVDILADVLKHPSGRFIVEFAFHSNGDPNDNDLQDLIDLLGKKAPPTTRKITFGDNVDQISWHHTGSLAKLWKGVPNLTTLDIETGDFEVGKMVAPALEKARFITGGLSKSCGKNLATATMPNIEHLEIYYGTEDYGGTCTVKEVAPLLARTDLPKLRYLGLKNSEFANDIARALGGAKIVKHLTTLDLSLGTLTDEGAAALAAIAPQLSHLETLDLTHNYLTKAGIALVKNLCKNVVVKDQQKPDAWDDELHYYAAVRE